jgi:hypothetical protein
LNAVNSVGGGAGLSLVHHSDVSQGHVMDMDASEGADVDSVNHLHHPTVPPHPHHMDMGSGNAGRSGIRSALGLVMPMVHSVGQNSVSAIGSGDSVADGIESSDDFLE